MHPCRKRLEHWFGVVGIARAHGDCLYVFILQDIKAGVCLHTMLAADSFQPRMIDVANSNQFTFGVFHKGLRKGLTHMSKPNDSHADFSHRILLHLFVNHFPMNPFTLPMSKQRIYQPYLPARFPANTAGTPAHLTPYPHRLFHRRTTLQKMKIVTHCHIHCAGIGRHETVVCDDAAFRIPQCEVSQAPLHCSVFIDGVVDELALYEANTVESVAIDDQSSKCICIASLYVKPKHGVNMNICTNI